MLIIYHEGIKMPTICQSYIIMQTATLKRELKKKCKYRHSSISAVLISTIFDLLRLIILSYFPPLQYAVFASAFFCVCPHINSVNGGMPVPLFQLGKDIFYQRDHSKYFRTIGSQRLLPTSLSIILNPPFENSTTRIAIYSTQSFLKRVMQV